MPIYVVNHIDIVRASSPQEALTLWRRKPYDGSPDAVQEIPAQGPAVCIGGLDFGILYEADNMLKVECPPVLFPWEKEENLKKK